MSELAEIAASVAKALNLWASGKKEWYDDERGGYSLGMDGRAVFEDHWQVRCRDWLLANGQAISHHRPNETLIGSLYMVGPVGMTYARAIHALITARKE